MSEEAVKQPPRIALMLLMLIIIIAIIFLVFNPFGSVRAELTGFSTKCLQWTQTYCKDLDEAGMFTTNKGEEVEMFGACQAKLGTGYDLQMLYKDTTEWNKFLNNCRQQCQGCPPAKSGT